ncbi:putative oxygenase MesX [Glutamicibacter arilaitensis]
MTYDRDERTQLGKIQGKFTEEHFISPHRELLESWAASCAVPAA